VKVCEVVTPVAVLFALSPKFHDQLVTATLSVEPLPEKSQTRFRQVGLPITAVGAVFAAVTVTDFVTVPCKPPLSSTISETR
jgi:hypothetical protein